MRTHACMQASAAAALERCEAAATRPTANGQRAAWRGTHPAPLPHLEQREIEWRLVAVVLALPGEAALHQLPAARHRARARRQVHRRLAALVARVHKLHCVCASRLRRVDERGHQLLLAGSGRRHQHRGAALRPRGEDGAAQPARRAGGVAVRLQLVGHTRSIQDPQQPRLCTKHKARGEAGCGGGVGVQSGGSPLGASSRQRGQGAQVSHDPSRCGVRRPLAGRVASHGHTWAYVGIRGRTVASCRQLVSS